MICKQERGIPSIQSEKKLYHILAGIEQADDFEINEIINAVIRRYQAVFPDWEVMFLSLPKNDPEERRKALQSIINFLKNHEKL